MILTREQFEAGRSDAGGHNLAQLRALGLDMPERGWPKSGWPDRLIGKKVTDEQYAEFMRLRGKAQKGRRVHNGQNDLPAVSSRAKGQRKRPPVGHEAPRQAAACC